jgi:hypothetical protein
VFTARRVSRQGETFIKKFVSEFGYGVINRIADVSIPRNTGDFRLLSRRVVEELRGLSESHGFLRGLVALVGFSQAEVLYNRDARQGRLREAWRCHWRLGSSSPSRVSCAAYSISGCLSAASQQLQPPLSQHQTKIHPKEDR